MNKIKQNRQITYFIIIALMIGIFLLSLKTGKYLLSFEGIFAGDEMQRRVFLTLRLPRACVGLIAGIGLGISGMIYQTIFSNSLASPDMIGVSSGASVGAAIAILFLVNQPLYVTSFAFVGSVLAIIFSLSISRISSMKGNATIILSGLVVHSLAQTILMMLKTIADPEKELAAIEYWIMGSLNAITLDELPFMCIITIGCTILLILLYRQIMLLSLDEGEAKLLGVSVGRVRLLVLLLATLIVAASVSVTGVISFVGLLAPHMARMLTKNTKLSTLLLSGAIGGIILCSADILARTLADSELPVSVFTSLIGAPFLLMLIVNKGRKYE